MTIKKECAKLKEMLKIHKIPLQKMQPVTNLSARIGSQSLSYRYHPAKSTRTLVLFHGLISNSIYLSALAYRLAERNIAQVLIPNQRGHGEDQRPLFWGRPQEVLQDFEEILIHLKNRTSVQEISFLGHSFGAQWLFKILEQAPASMIPKECYLIAPYVKSEQLRKGWLKEKQTTETTDKTYRIPWPESLRGENEVVEYPQNFFDTFQLNESVLSKSNFHVVESRKDEIVHPLEREQWIRWGVGDLHTVQDESHMGLVMAKDSIELICDLIERS